MSHPSCTAGPGSERQGQVEQRNSRWIDPWVNTCVCFFKIFLLKTAAAREQEKSNVISHGRIFQRVTFFFRNKLYLSGSLHMAVPSMVPVHYLGLLLLSKILLLWLTDRLLFLLLAASKKWHYILQMRSGIKKTLLLSQEHYLFIYCVLLEKGIL